MILISTKAGGKCVEDKLRSLVKLTYLWGIRYYLGVTFRWTGNVINLQKAENRRHVLERFEIEKAKPTTTAMVVNIHSMFEVAVTSEAEQNSTQTFPYWELLGILLYLSTLAQPCIIFVVNILSQFVESPLQDHRWAVKRLLRYLDGTKNHVIMNGNVQRKKYCQGRETSRL